LVGFICQVYSPKMSLIIGAVSLIMPLCCALVLPSQLRLEQLKGQTPVAVA